MRPGYKYVDDERTTVDRTPEEFAQTMGYASARFETPDEFVAAHDERWVHELHDKLRDLLDPARTTLSIGSGAGEHEVLLHVAGYDVIASDVVPGVLDEAGRLFPGLRTMTYDVFSGEPVECDDVLITGLDFYFEDPQAEELLRRVHALVTPGGRCVFTMRYVDTPASWAIDRLALPAVALAARARGRRRVRKHHGYRRSVRELRELAARAGFRVGRVQHAGFGMELARFAPVPRAVQRLDRRLHVLSSATILELLA